MEDDEATEIAERAAGLFLGRSANLEFLGRGESVTHRVETPEGVFLLRMHVPLHPPFDPTHLAPAAIASECAWLSDLATRATLVAPEPVLAPDGEYVLEVAGIPCTLLRWVEGTPLEGQPTAEQAAQLGSLLAALHDHAQGWTPPAEFVRPLHDRRWTREALRRLEALAAEGIVADTDVARLTRSVDILEREFPMDSDRSGLIHADLHDENYVFHGEEARPIDFGRCGFGPWLYDVAECAMHLFPDRRKDLLRAYSESRPLAEDDVRGVEGYLIAAVIETYGHHSPNPAEHESLAKNLAAVADRHVRRYLEGQPFLFEV